MFIHNHNKVQPFQTWSLSPLVEKKMRVGFKASWRKGVETEMLITWFDQFTSHACVETLCCSPQRHRPLQVYILNIFRTIKERLSKIGKRNVGKDTENRNSNSLLLSFNTHGHRLLRNCRSISYKIKYILTIWSNNCTPWYLPKWV